MEMIVAYGDPKVDMTAQCVANYRRMPQVSQVRAASPRHRESSGTVLYRRVGDDVEILLVHPAGNFNRRAPWGIPKGQPLEGESLEDAARRETWEETGIVVETLVSLGLVEYTRSAKRVHAFVGKSPANAVPRCASHEVDKAQFIELSRAKRIMHPDQVVFVDRLIAYLTENPGE